MKTRITKHIMLVIAFSLFCCNTPQKESLATNKHVLQYNIGKRPLQKKIIKRDREKEKIILKELNLHDSIDNIASRMLLRDKNNLKFKLKTKIK